MPSSPQNVPLVRVYDYLIVPTGGATTNATPRSGRTVTLTLVPATSGGTPVIASSISPVTQLPSTPIQSSVSDGNGYWEVWVVPTDNILPSGMQYLLDDGYRTYRVNPVAAGIPINGWQSSAIITSSQPNLGGAGQTIPGPVTITGTLTVTGLTTATGGLVVGGPTWSVNAAGDIAARSFTAVAGSPPYTSSAIAGSINDEYWVTPPTGVAATDTANIQAGLTAMTATGGNVRLWPGIYAVNSTLVIPPGVCLRGAWVELGIIFGDSVFGTMINVSTGAYNAFETSATACKGAGLMDLAFNGFTDTTHYVIRIKAADGFRMENIAIRQAATGANGILFGGGTPSALQCQIDNISINCGGGFTGGVGMQLGLNSGGEIFVANSGKNWEIQGYATNLVFDNGGGCEFSEVWTQFPATTGIGIQINTWQSLKIDGGWFEQLGTGCVFGASAVNCRIEGCRVINTVTTPYTDAGTGNIFNNDGTWHGGALAATAALTEPVGGTAPTGTYVGVISSKPMVALELSGSNSWELQNAAGTLTAVVYGAATAMQLGQNGAMTLAGRVMTAKATPAYSASITPDASAANWQTITVTNSTAFTINAPTNAPSSSQTEELTIEIFNNSGGAMGVITWNGAFILVGGAFTNPASTKRRYIRFEWNGANWVETNRAGADY
jgi:hypothetical protein